MFAKMSVNEENCVSISQVWPHSLTEKAHRDPNPFFIHTDFREEEIPMEIVSISLGMPIGSNRFENSKHEQKVLASVMEDARTIGESKLKITQKMHPLKTFAFSCIDYRRTCSDLN
jgi:hypothetical protein